MHHTAELVERHAIMLPLLGVRQPDHRQYTDEVDEARRRAHDWADAHGLELIGLGETVWSGGHERGPAIGVTFGVVVGKGDISPDQRVPGALDSWRWSGPRMKWWQALFNQATSAHRSGRLVARQADQLATVTRLRRNMPTAPPQPGLDAACTCALGGPLADLCPIHYDG